MYKPERFIALTQHEERANWEIVEGDDLYDASVNYEESIDHNVSSFIMLPYKEALKLACSIMKYELKRKLRGK